MEYLRGLVSPETDRRAHDGDSAGPPADLEQQDAASRRAARRAARDFVRDDIMSRADADAILAEAGLEWWDGTGKP